MKRSEVWGAGSKSPLYHSLGSLLWLPEPLGWGSWHQGTIVRVKGDNGEKMPVIRLGGTHSPPQISFPFYLTSIYYLPVCDCLYV